MILTAEQAARFARQLMLREVGEQGQLRILEGTAAVAGPADSLAHEVAERYARAAGFARLAPGAIDLDALAPSELVKQEAARELLAGSRAALAAIRDMLPPSVPPRSGGSPVTAANEEEP